MPVQAPATIKAMKGGINAVDFMRVAMEVMMAVRLKELTAPAVIALEASRETGSAAASASAAKPASSAAENEPPTWQPRRMSFRKAELDAALERMRMG